MSRKFCGIVYKVTNKIDGKVYIGRTAKHLAIRWAYHLLATQCLAKGGLDEAIQEQGPDSFEVVQLASFEDEDEWVLGEARFISLYKSNQPECGYNKSPGQKKLPSQTRAEDERAEQYRISLSKYWERMAQREEFNNTVDEIRRITSYEQEE